MKKVIAVVAIVAVAACFASCKKTCTCVTSTTGLPDVTQTVEATNCADMNTSTTTMGITTETKCS